MCQKTLLQYVLRLSRGMAYKAALAGLSFGGGKAVILAPNCGEKSPALFQAFGRFVHSLAGRYITAKVVAGSANNQLAEDRHGADLAARGILYAPDYVINAGGIINISHEGRAYSRDEAMAHCVRIHDTLAEIFERAKRESRPTNEIADQLAEERISRRRAGLDEGRLRMAAG